MCFHTTSLDAFGPGGEGNRQAAGCPDHSGRRNLGSIRQHHRQQVATPTRKPRKKDAKPVKGSVFTTTAGTPLEPRNVNRAFASLRTKAGVRQMRLHDLRHSCSTLLFSMGVDAATVQKILRHTSITVTTNAYIYAVEELKRTAVDNMDSLFGAGERRDDERGLS